MLNFLFFIQPLWLWSFIPVLCLLIWLLLRQHKSVGAIAGEGIIATHLARIFSLHKNKQSSKKPIFFTLTAVTFLIVSLAQPQLNLVGDETLKSPLIIALDLSESMDKKDDAGFSTLQRSQLIIDSLLEKGFNRPISLIAFAASAHQVLPVSEQSTLLRLYLSYLEPSVMPEEGDDINQLLTEVNSIKKAQEFGYDLLIISDGFSVNSSLFNEKNTANQSLLLALNRKAEDQGEALGLEVLTGNYLDSGDNHLYQRLSDLTKESKSKKTALTNIGYWFLYPLFFIALYFFRKGFSLNWLPMIILSISIMPNTAEARFMDWWMTADQQGAYYFKKQDYKEAALRFENQNWKAAAYVNAKEYKKAVVIYEKQDDLTGLFNLAVTNAKGRQYYQAQKLYQLLLTIEPDNSDAQKNLYIIAALIKEIQETAKKQQEEAPPSENNETQDMIDEQLGAEYDQIGKREVHIESISVDELLNSDQKKQQWLRDISRDPKLFLGAKFQAEYNKRLSKKQLDEGDKTNE